SRHRHRRAWRRRRPRHPRHRRGGRHGKAGRCDRARRGQTAQRGHGAGDRFLARSGIESRERRAGPDPDRDQRRRASERAGKGMNAPFREAETKAALRLFAFFHLNLAFSSIEEERRGEVIARCYWPLLKLADNHVIGMEISGYTLEEIAMRDPRWIARARELISFGRIELIGSGYSQMIGPLVPARVTRENLALGIEAYEKFLGVRPHLALVGEQAYSAG